MKIIVKINKRNLRGLTKIFQSQIKFTTMKRIYEISGAQLREKAILRINNTGFNQDRELFFVQLDDLHAVDNTGAIFQIVNMSYADDVAEIANALQYEGESGTIYNYAEDRADFSEDSDDLEIYSHCTEQAELLFDEFILPEIRKNLNLNY